MEFEIFKIKFEEKLQKLNIDANINQIKQFYAYMNLLIEWNKNINLTTIIEPEEIILKHFIDSLTIVKDINDNDSIADIGTGAGFPGIPLKIIKPYSHLILLDSLNKRIKFLEQVIKDNKMENIVAIHARAEEIGHDTCYRTKFDIVTSRAVAKLNVLAEYMLPLLKIGGKAICLKGPNVLPEIEEAKQAIEILGGQIENIEEIILPDSDNKRTIITIKCVKQSPNKYPRNPGTPTTSPL